VSGGVEQEAGGARRAAGFLFNAAGDLDLTIGPADDWQSITRQFPSGCQPDFVALYLP